MALGFIIGFVVGAALTIFFMDLPLSKIPEEDRREIERMVKRAYWQSRKRG